jgi:hypothetical protein
MKRLAGFILAIATLLLISTLAKANCHDTAVQGTDTFTGGCSGPASLQPVTKTAHFTIYWLDGYSRPLDVTENGDTGSTEDGCFICFPIFNSPTWEELSDGTAY